MFRKPLVLTLLVTLVLLAGLSLAVFTGIYRPKFLSGLPLLKKADSGMTEKASDSLTVQELKLENEHLKKELADLRKSAVAGANDSQSAAAGGTGNDGQLHSDQTYQNLAGYYAGMKPAAAAQILKNQDTREVAGILANMDSDQAGEILSAMDPALAARLVELIAGIEDRKNAGSGDGSDLGNY